MAAYVLKTLYKWSID